MDICYLAGSPLSPMGIICQRYETGPDVDRASLLGP